MLSVISKRVCWQDTAIDDAISGETKVEVMGGGDVLEREKGS